jgi:hypothetical protein
MDTELWDVRTNNFPPEVGKRASTRQPLGFNWLLIAYVSSCCFGFVRCVTTVSELYSRRERFDTLKPESCLNEIYNFRS